MGLTLHYHGKLKSPLVLADLIEEVTDICQSAGWPCRTLDDVLEGVPEDYVNLLGADRGTGYRARGVSFQVHPQAESTTLCFGPDGRTLSPMALHRPDLTDWDDDMLAHHTFTKTQLAGPEAHVTLCRLLKYLAGKYFFSFEVTDEGDYYETENLATLHERFADYSRSGQLLTAALAEASLPSPATSLPELLDYIAKAMPGVDFRLLGEEEE